MTPEKKVENAILDWLRSKGFYVWKNQSTGLYDPTKKLFRKSFNTHHLKGVSDVLGLLPNGVLLAIEVKTDNTPWSKKTYPSKEQKLFLENVVKLNGVGFVARSVDDVEKVLKQEGYL